MIPAGEWERCAPWIEAAVAHGQEYTLAGVLELIEAGEAQFWPGEHAAMVTQIVVYPGFKVIFCWLAGGDMGEIVDHLRPAAEAWGKLQGCKRAEISGRPGWAQVLKGKGYEVSAVTLAKDLG